MKVRSLNMTILVVEDERSLCEAVQFKLESGGFSVMTARAIDQAIALLQKAKKIDAIWLDHYLFGNQNGLDLMFEIHDNKLWQDMPVFVVSNTVSPDKVKTYLSLGAQKYYTKVDNRLDTIVGDITKLLGVGVT